MQTIQGILKYLDEPITSVIYYKPVDSEDTPSITVCQYPGINFRKLDAFFESQTNMSKKLLWSNKYKFVDGLGQIIREQDKFKGTRDYEYMHIDMDDLLRNVTMRFELECDPKANVADGMPYECAFYDMTGKLNFLLLLLNLIYYIYL
jgi:hypothetical protein